MWKPNTIEIAGKEVTFTKKFDVITGLWVFNAEATYEIADEQIVAPIEIKHIEEILPEEALFKAKFGAEKAIKKMLGALTRKVHHQIMRERELDAEIDRYLEEH